MYGKIGDRIIGFEDSLRGLRALHQTPAQCVLIGNVTDPKSRAMIPNDVLHFESFDVIADKFIEKLVEKTKSLKIGLPWKKDVFLGPIINEAAKKKFEAAVELAVIEKIIPHLNSGKPARLLALTPDEKKLLQPLFLMTSKPLLYLCNVDEKDVNGKSEMVQKVKTHAHTEHAGMVVISGAIESEIAQMNGEDKQAFLADYGLKESGLDRLSHASYELLGFITYFTAGPKEVKAWTIEKGTKAPQAAGKIHSDFERGFIAADVYAYEDLLSCGTEAKAKEKGLIRLEGKEYVVKDGDIMLFKFNV